MKKALKILKIHIVYFIFVDENSQKIKKIKSLINKR